jgi:WD40 repeat protein
VSGDLRLLRAGHDARTLTTITEAGSIESCAYSPDGTLVAAGRRLVETATGDTVLELDLQGAEAFAMEFSPDGSYLAVARDSLTILDLGGGTPVLRSAPGAEIKALAFSSDGSQIVSGGFDGIARVWDATSGDMRLAVDVGINCYGADVTGSIGFGERSFLLRADWERWWAGLALRQRLTYCGAVDLTTGGSPARPEQEAPCAVWDGSVYSAWVSALKWVPRDEAYRLLHGKEPSGSYGSSDFFAGAASGFMW